MFQLWCPVFSSFLDDNYDYRQALQMSTVALPEHHDYVIYVAM